MAEFFKMGAMNYERAQKASVRGKEILEKIINLDCEEQRREINKLPERELVDLFQALPLEESVDLIESLAPVQILEVTRALPSDLSAEIIKELPAPVSGHLLRDLGEEGTEEIIRELENEEKASLLQQRLNYREDTAGALMRYYALSYQEATEVKTFLEEIRIKKEEYHDEDFQYFYTVDPENRLTGVINSRSLLLSAGNQSLGEIKISSPFTVLDTTPLDELDDIVTDKHYLSFPVVNADGVFLGVVGRDAILDAVAEREADQFLKSRGVVGGEELRSMPLLSRGFKRLSWLGPNIGLNMLGAVVISLFQGTLEQVILLAVFLPVVSNMSGCSGSQAIAVSIRELTMGVTTPRDAWYVMKKEFLVGVPSGVLLGILLGIIAGIWGKNVVFGLVVGGALFLNTIVSVVLGGYLPLLLKKLKIDPALASSPILSTSTDLCGFFFILSFASLALNHLT